MYMSYTQGQNEEYVLTIQEYVLNQVLTISNFHSVVVCARDYIA